MSPSDFREKNSFVQLIMVQINFLMSIHNKSCHKKKIQTKTLFYLILTLQRQKTSQTNERRKNSSDLLRKKTNGQKYASLKAL